MPQITLAGVGKAIPDITPEITGKRVGNKELVHAISNQTDRNISAEYIENELGIESRFLMSAVDPSTGKPANPSNIDEISMAATSAENAFENSEGINPRDIDELFYITATTNPFFNEGARALSRELGLRAVDLHEMNVGCGGVGVAMTRARKLLKGSDEQVALIVASHAPSKHMNRDLFAQEGQIICQEIFGDGAGAMILQKKQVNESRGIISFYQGVENEIELMRSDIVSGERVYYIHGQRTAIYFQKLMKKAYRGLVERADITINHIDNLLLHQVNGKIFDKFCKDTFGINPDLDEKIPKHVHKYGNLSAASTLVLMAEEYEEGRLQTGDLCLLVVMGAGNGSQFASVLFRF